MSQARQICQSSPGPLFKNMSCVKPWVRIPTSQVNKNTGNHSAVMRDLESLTHGEKSYRSYIEWKNNFMASHPEQKSYGSPQLIGCGKCAACRLQKSREWANRCMLELEDHESAYFLTLTYDDDHLFQKDGKLWSPDCGREPSVLKDHVRMFMRKLRDSTGQNLRFFACGEYGTSPRPPSKVLRPHYHIIVFGLQIPDLRFYKKSNIQDNYYTSEFINRCWCLDMRSDPTPLGYVVIGDLTWESAAYTARYCMKKLNSDVEIWKLYNKMDVNEEFTIMSTHPGIARKYFDRNGPSVFLTDGISISTVTGGRKITVPKYFKRLCSDTYCEFADYLSDIVVEDAELRLKRNLENYSGTQSDFNHMQDEVIRNKIKTLRRKEF